MIEQKFLPIGSVCILKDATRKVMITGFLAKGESSDKVYDYVGCMYPEGVLSSQQNLLFDHDQIVKIFSLGYKDEEETNFKSRLMEYLKNEGSTVDLNNAVVPATQPQVAPAVEAPVQPVVEIPVQPMAEVPIAQPQVTPTVETPVQPVVENKSEVVTTNNSNVSPFNILKETNISDAETLEVIENI